MSHSMRKLDNHETFHTGWHPHRIAFHATGLLVCVMVVEKRGGHHRLPLRQKRAAFGTARFMRKNNKSLVHTSSMTVWVTPVNACRSRDVRRRFAPSKPGSPQRRVATQRGRQPANRCVKGGLSHGSVVCDRWRRSGAGSPPAGVSKGGVSHGCAVCVVCDLCISPCHLHPHMSHLMCGPP